MEYYSAIKKNKIMPFVAIWIDLVSEVSQTEKDKYMILLICGKKKCTNELILTVLMSLYTNSVTCFISRSILIFWGGVLFLTFIM